MPLLDRFAPPASLTELPSDDAQSWSDFVSSMFDPFTESRPQFFNPTVTDTPADSPIHKVEWTAFPATLLQAATSQEGRWAAADASRDSQDEYCEWAVSRDPQGHLRSVTFTTETPDYFRHLAIQNPELLVDLYQQFTGRQIDLEDLQGSNGEYDPDNSINRSTEGDIVHLAQSSNNLEAAITLAAEATVLRERPDGTPVVNQQELVQCGGLGVPSRNSDPQIASAVNNLVAQGFDITLDDPLGLYISELLTTDINAPDGTDPFEFWTVERGTDDLALRARFEVPAGFPYTTSQITVAGRPLQFGAQLADRVRIKLSAVAKPSSSNPIRVGCE